MGVEYENFVGVPDSFDVGKIPSGSVKATTKIDGKKMTVWRTVKNRDGVEGQNPNFDTVQQAFMDSAKVQVRCGVKPRTYKKPDGSEGSTTDRTIYEVEVLGVEEDPFARDAGGGVAGGTMTSASRTPTPAAVAESVPGVRLARDSEPETTTSVWSRPSTRADLLQPGRVGLLQAAATLVARYDEDIRNLEDAVSVTFRVADLLAAGPQVKEWDTGAVA